MEEGGGGERDHGFGGGGPEVLEVGGLGQQDDQGSPTTTF